ncbi:MULTISPECIES: MBL fold metallo-hydrolase [unclassified Streptomyces]|uniref:MBL fold metallo-hydrolase n=1 Tax=unclassified Streptomyces TaxID=2593676 RepID=UPI0006AF9AEF|nr:MULTISPECIES: MBL fold metallo-hydrolase [unclassified Streptomyces]KOX23558.1 beta-lactamase [Streptomyces sp. NRRL F-6491]KOX40352.1 beta-lactamase [Streptomyces sp. NRRL F-6492]
MPDLGPERVADGVHAWVQPDGGWCLNNAGVVVGDRSVLLVDTAATRARAERLRDAVRGLTPLPVRTVVNTHHHGDHTHGNLVFSDGAVVVSHERTRAEMAERGLALTKVWPDADWGDLDVVLPDLTYADSLSVHLGGGRTAELLHPGPAHTTNDTAVWLPDAGVLFAGDLLMSDCTPFALMGSVRGLVRAVGRLRALGPRRIVCGHGPVCGPEVFAVTEAYLARVLDLAAYGLRRGRDPLAVAREAGHGEFADLRDPERLVANLHRAYAELEGAPEGAYLPSAPVFREMVELNGGRPLTCLA